MRSYVRPHMRALASNYFFISTLLGFCQRGTVDLIDQGGALINTGLPCKPHMWTAAPGKHFFDVSNDLVDCAHMSGLLARSIFPLALMKSDNLDPYHIRELCAHEVWRVVPDLRWRPCRSSRLIALAKLEPVYLPCELRVPATDGFLTPSQTSRFGSIRRSSSSPRESGPACWPAPP